MTGKGWGGTCLVLADDSFTESDAELVAQAYSRRFQTRCNYFTVSAAQAASVTACDSRVFNNKEENIKTDDGKCSRLCLCANGTFFAIFREHDLWK